MCWAGGETHIIQEDPMDFPLSDKDRDFIAQQAREFWEGCPLSQAAAAAPEKPKAQGSSHVSATSKQAPVSRDGALQSQD